jgi:deoxyhypusine synthase
LTAYVTSQCQPRPLKRLYDRRSAMIEELQRLYLQAQFKQQAEAKVGLKAEPVATYPCGTPIKGRP